MLPNRGPFKTLFFGMIVVPVVMALALQRGAGANLALVIGVVAALAAAWYF